MGIVPTAKFAFPVFSRTTNSATTSRIPANQIATVLPIHQRRVAIVENPPATSGYDQIGPPVMSNHRHVTTGLAQQQTRCTIEHHGVTTADVLC